MVLKAKGKFIDTSSIECLLTQGEKYSDKIHFVLPIINNDVDISGCIFALRTVASEGSMTETILTAEQRDDDLLLTWDVPETVTAVPGMLQMELVGSRGTDIIIKYKMPAVYVKAAIMGDHLPVPDVIDEKLAEMNTILAQAEAKINEAKMIAASVDSTLTMAGQAAEAKAVGDIISAINNEITAARTSSISCEEYSNLQERLESDFSYLKKVMKSVEAISSYVVVDIENGDNTDSEWYADDTLRITGIGSIDAGAFEKRNDFGALEIDIGGDVGTGAFGACEILNIATVNCAKICNKAFMGCPRLGVITIGTNVQEIGTSILEMCAFYISAGIRIMYAGTIDQWNAITKADNWIGNGTIIADNIVICADGTVEV